jgi:hypothetical protein
MKRQFASRPGGLSTGGTARGVGTCPLRVVLHAEAGQQHCTIMRSRLLDTKSDVIDPSQINLHVTIGRLIVVSTPAREYRKLQPR